VRVASTRTVVGTNTSVHAALIEVTGVLTASSKPTEIMPPRCTTRSVSTVASPRNHLNFVLTGRMVVRVAR